MRGGGPFFSPHPFSLSSDEIEKADPAPPRATGRARQQQFNPFTPVAISGPSSYSTTTVSFAAHWEQADARLAPQALVVRLPDSDTAVTLAQFVALRDTLWNQQFFTVTDCLMSEGIIRGGINLAKAALLKQLNLFTALLDAYYRHTDFHDARPHAPSIGDGQEKFTDPLLDAATLWERMNEGPAPAGVTLPLVLGDGTTQENFSDAVDALIADYRAEKLAAQETTLARAKRNRLQNRAYAIMKAYREAVPVMLVAFPAMLDTLPRLTPLPGHTPVPVEATATLLTPGSAKISHGASADKTLRAYQLRGNVGNKYDEEYAVVLGTHGPGDAREFVTTFGLEHPGTSVALKLFVILTTDNEAGSAAMILERPAVASAPPAPSVPAGSPGA